MDGWQNIHLIWINRATGAMTGTMTGAMTGGSGAVLLALWDAFAREGIAIPKPGAQQIVLERRK